MDYEQMLIWTDLYNRTFYTTFEYRNYCNIIHKQGFVEWGVKYGVCVKIYTPELAHFFMSGALSAEVYPTKEKIEIDGSVYFQTYVEGYNEGEKYWNENLAVSTNVLYGANAESYVNDLYEKYHFIKLKREWGFEGWSYVKWQSSPSITHSRIREYGYYSGIVSKVDELVKQHPKLFAVFELQKVPYTDVFDRLFKEAVRTKSIDLNINPNLPKENQQAIRELSKGIYEHYFKEFLKQKKNWREEETGAYSYYATKETWNEFIRDRRTEIQAEVEAEQATWEKENVTPLTETQQPANDSEKDFFLSTIEKWLSEFKEKMSEADYQTLVSALKQYIDSGQFPTLKKKIQVKGRPNIKSFGWALNRIFEAHGKGIEKELLLFAKQNISLFTDVLFDENDIRKSNLYKYFTTQMK